jgi:hypothetical protein
MMTMRFPSAMGSLFTMLMAAAWLTAPVFADELHQDVDMTIQGGKLVTGGGEYATGPLAGRVFHTEVAPGTPYSTIEPGFDAADGTFSAGNQVRFDFVQQLLYWNGTVLAAPTADVTVSLGGNTRTISGADTAGLQGFIEATAGSNGGFHQDLNWSLPATAPDGLYGVVLTLGPQAGTTGFAASDSFLIGFQKGVVNDIPGGLEAMATVAAVPEPSTWVLCGIGIATAAWHAKRRKNRLPGCSKPV